MSCAACRNARGYSTPCPYCREPGNLQREQSRLESQEARELEKLREVAEENAAMLEEAQKRIRSLEQKLGPMPPEARCHECQGTGLNKFWLARQEREQT